MATKKQATKTTTQQHMEAELAAHIAAVLAHPGTPTALYNAIAQEITDLYSAVPDEENHDTAEMIERALNWHRGLGFRNIDRAGSK